MFVSWLPSLRSRNHVSSLHPGCVGIIVEVSRSCICPLLVCTERVGIFGQSVVPSVLLAGSEGVSAFGVFRGRPPFAPLAFAAALFALERWLPMREPTLILCPQWGHCMG